MPRQSRISIPGAIFHVITRGLNRQELFRDDQDRNEFLARFSLTLENTKSRCYAWSLMPNHVHLMVRCSEFPLGQLMRSLLTGYAVYFNRRHRRVGYLYQNRYKSILCQEDVYFLELVRYIHLNPLRARIVTSFDKLDRYPWTGHSILLGYRAQNWQSTSEVLARFSSSKPRAIAAYRAFVRDGLKSPAPDLEGGGLRRSAGGWRGVEELERNKNDWRGDARILGDGDFVNRVLESAEEKVVLRDELRRKGWDLNKVIQRACEIANLDPEDLRRRGRENTISKAKSLVAYWATDRLGLSGEHVGLALHITRQAVMLNARRGKQWSEQENINLLS